MANRYWGGGTGTWSTTDTTHWYSDAALTTLAGAVPTAADAVFFQQASTYTVTMTGALLCLDITVSAGVVTFATGTTPTLAVSGSMSLVAGTVWSSTGGITFNSTTTGKTITTNGTSLSAATINFNGVAGAWSLGSALTTVNTATVTITNGALSLNGFDLTTGIFASSGTATRSIAFGANNIVLVHPTAAQTVLSFATATGFTWTGTGGFTTTAAVTRTVVFGTTGGTSAIAPNLTLTDSGTSVITFTTASWFNKLDFGTTAFNPGTTALNLNGFTLSSGGTFTNLTPTMVGTGTITSNGNTTLALMTINSTTGTTTLGAAFALTATSTITFTSGTLDLAGFNLSTGIFSSNNSNTRAVAFGSGNIVLTHTTSTTTVLSMATVTGFTYTGTGGWSTDAAVARTINFGATGGGTSTNAPSCTLTGSGTAVITFTGNSWFNKLDFGTTAFTFVSATMNLNSLTLSSGGTFTTLTANMVGTGTIISNTKTIAALTIASTSGTTSLGSALSLVATGTTTLTSGTLSLNGFDLTTGIFSSNNANTRAITFGSNNIVLAHTSAAQTVLDMATATGFTYTGTGGFTTTAAVTRTVNFGATAGGTSTNAPNLTLTASGTSVITFTTASWFNTLSFGTTAFTIAATNLNLNGLTLSTGGTFTSLTASMRGTGTITSNGNTTLGPLVINNGAGTTTLAAALTCTTYTQTAGAINFATFNLTCSSTVSYTAGTLSNIGTISCTTWTITGTFTMSSGTITPSVSFVLTSGSFNYNGGTLTTPVFTHTAGTVTLGAGLNIGSTGTYTFTAGTLNLNGFDLTVGAFSSSNTNTRSIAFGTNNIILNHATAATTVLSMGTVTGFSATGTGGFVTDASTTRTVTFGTTGGSATNSLPLSLTGSGTSVITFTTASWFNKLNFGTTAFTVATTSLNLNSLTLSNGGNFNALTASMRATGVVEGSGNTTLGALTINHTGTTTFSSALTLSATGTVTLTSGTIDLSGFDLTTGIFSSSGSTARTVTFGSNKIVLSHTTAATTVLSMATVTAFTWTGTGGFASGMSVTRTFTFGTTGGSTTTAPNLFINSGSSVPTFTDGSWFEILDFTGSSCAPAMSASVIGIYVDTLTLATGGTFTGLIPVFTRTQTWTAQFSKQLGGIGVNIPSGTLTLDSTQTYSATSSTILTAGTLDLGGADLTTGLLSSSNANTRAIAFGANKIILAHTTAATTVLAMANATGFTYTGTGLFNTDASVTRTLTFGTTAGSTTNAPSLTLTGSGTAVITLTTASWYNNLDFGTTAFTIGTTTLNLNGNLTLSTGGTFTGLSATMVGTGSINSNGGAIAALVVNNDVGTTSLTAALSCTTFTMTAGTIDFNFFNLTCSGAVTYTSGTMLDMPTITCTTWTVAGTFTMTSGTITPSVSFVLSSGAFNYNGGTLSPVPTFTHTAGTVTLGQAYALTATGTYTLTAGTLNLNGFNLTTGAFSSSNTNTRSIVFGAGNIVLAHTTVATTVLSMATATGFTNTGTGGFVTDASITRTVTFGTTGGASTISPNLTLTGSGAAVITFTTASWFNKLDFGTTAFTIGTTTLNLNSFTLSSTGTFTTLTANMVDDGTIVNNGNNTLGALTINSTTGTTSLGDAFTISAIAATTLTSGTLNLNGFDLTTGSFSSTNANTRAITFGSNNIVLAHVLAGTTVLSMATTTGFTWTGTGGFTTNASVTRTYVFGTTGGSATNAPNLLITSGASVPTFTDGSWFNTLSFTGTTCTPAVTASAIGIYVSTLTLATGGTYTSLIPVFTRTQTWTAQFSKQLGGIGVNGTGVTLTLDNTQTYTATSAVFLVAGTIDLGGVDLTVGVFNSNNTNTRAISFGTNNIILATTTAAQTVLNMATATGFTYTGTGGFISDASVTRTFNFGATIGGTNATAPNLSFTGSGTAVQTFQSGGKFGNLSFGTTAFNPGTTALSLNGLTLSSGGTFSTLTATMFGTGTITSNGNTTLTTLNINGVGILSTLGDALTMAATGTVTITNGTLALNVYDLTTGIFASSGTGTRSISFGSNNIVLAHTTAATVVLSFATATGFTWTGTGGFRTDASITRTVTFGTTGGSATNAPNLSLTGSGTSVITLTTASWFNNLSFGTTAFNPGTTTLNLNSLSLSSGGTFTTMTATMVGTGTITPNGNTTLGVLTINSTTGTTTLGAALTLNTNATTTLTSGTLTLNGFDLTTGIFSSNNATSRAISFGTNNIVLAHTTAATTVLAMPIVTNFTNTGTGGFVTDASITRTVTFGTTGGSTTNSPNLALTGSGTSVITFTTGSWFDKLDFGTTAFTIGTTNLNLNSLTLSGGGTFSTLTATMVGTGAITSNGNTTLGTLTINTGAGTTSLNSTFTIAATGTSTLTSGTLNLNGFDLTTGIFSSNNATSRAISFGTNNIVLAHTTAATTVLAMPIVTNFSWTGTGGFTTDASVTRTVTFGTTGGSTTNAPNLTLTGSGVSVITLTTNSWYNKLDFGTTAFTIGTTTLNLNSLSLSSGGTFTTLTAAMRGDGTLISNGNATLAILTINNTGTTTLGSAFALAATGTTTLTAGTLALGGYNLSTGIFSSTGAVTRAISFGSNNISLTHTTSSTVVLSMATVTGFSWTGTGGFTADTSVLNRTYTFGTTGGTSTNAPNLTFTTGNSLIVITTGSWFNKLDFGSTAWSASALTATVNVNSLTLTGTGVFTLTANMIGTGTLTSNGAQLGGPLNINNTSGTTTVVGAVNCTTFTVTSGTIDFANYSLTCNNNGLTGALNSFAPAGTLNLSTITCFSYTVNGSLTMTTGMSLTCTNVFLLSSVAFNYNGGTLSAATFSHASGTVTLGQALTLPNTSTYTMSGGTLDLAGFTLTTGIFTGTGTSARTVSFGSGNIVLAHPTAATTVLSLATATGFTFTGTGGFTTDASITRTLTFGTTGGSSTISPNLTLTGSGTSIITLTTGSWFNKLDFGTTVFTLGTTNLNLNSLSLSSGGSFSSFTATMVGTGTITPNGNTTLNRLTINNTGTTTLGAALTLNTNAITTLTSGTLTLNGFNLTTGQFVSSSGSTRVINFDTGNIILAHTTATTAVLACNDATGFTWTGTGGFVSDASITRTYAFGTTGGSATNSPNLSLTGSGTAIATLTTASWFNKLDFGSTAFVIAATNLNLNNVSLSSGGTFTNLTATMVGTGNITPNGNTTLGPVVINNGSGTTTLPAALSCTTFSMTAGTMDFAFFNLTCSSTFTYVSGTMLNMPTISCTTFTVNGTYTMTAGTITPSVSFVVQSGAFNYNGGTLSAVPTFTHTAGTVTLGQNYSLTATGTYTLTAGTLDLGGFTLTTGIFSSSNTNTRSISFGSGKIVLAHTTSATTVLSMATATGFTNTGTGGFQADASVSRTVTFGTTGGTATNAPNLTYTSGSFGLVITTGSWFKTIDFGTTLGSVSTVTLNLSSYILSTSGTYTGLTANMVGTGTIKGNGKEILALTINNVTGTTTLLDSPVFAAPGSSVTTLTSGTLDLNNFTLTTCSFSSSGALTRSIINGSNNIEVGFTTAGVTAMNMANLTGFSWVGAGGFVCAGLTTLNFIVGTTGGTTSNAPNLSIYAGSGQPLFTDGSLFNTLDFTGSTCTPAMTASVLGIHVSTLTLATGGTYTGFIPVFTRTQTWSMQFSKQLAGIGVNGSGVTLTLNGTQTYTATSQVILTAGTLDLGGYDITVGLFRSSNTNTRSVTFGSNKIILAHTTAATTVLSMATMTGFTCSGAGGFSTNMTVTRTFAIGTTAGGTSVGAPNLFFTGSGTALPTLTTSWLNKLDLSGITSFAAFQFINETSLNLNSFVGAGNAGFNGTYLNLNFVGSGSITNTNQDKIASIKINHNGTTILSTPIIMGTAGVFQNGGQTSGLVTLTSGTLQLDSYIYAAVGISSSNSNVRAITGNNNFYIDGATTSGTTPLNMANATNFTKSGTWRFVTSGTLASTYVFGTTGGSSSNAPSFFHQLMSGATSTFTSGSWFDKLDFTGSQSGAVAPTTTLNLNSLTLGASATYTGLSATMVGTGTITPNGKPIAALVINNGSGTTTLAGALTTNTSTTLTAGNLALAGYTLTPTQFISGGAATRTISGSGTGVISVANDWTVSNGTGFTGSDYTINMTKATAKTFAGAGGTYGKLVQAGAGALTISGSNNFADLQATTRPSTITFTAGTTQYFNLFSLEGTAGNLVTINSTVSGTQYYLSKSGTRVDVSYLSIRDSNVIGGASWFNNNGSNTVLSNNTGWNPISTGAFMAFF